jgi:putative hemolysin
LRVRREYARLGRPPERSIIAELAIILVLVLANGFFAGAEIAIVAVRKTRLAQLAEEGHKSAKAALVLRDRPEQFLATVQIGITVVSATAAAYGGSSIARQLAPLFAPLGPVGDEVSLAVVVALVSFLSIVVGELVPKSLALRSAERYALLVARALLVLSQMARPLVWVLTASSNIVLRPFGDRTTFTETRPSVDELQQLMEESTRAGEVHPHAGEIAARALELPELTAEDVMVPRQEVAMVPIDADREALSRIVVERAHDRMPVFDGTHDNVLGYVSVKDLLRAALSASGEISIRALMRPPFFVTERKRAVELLDEMRSRRQPFAMVVDERGGLSGIATIEDLIEELVGEIHSEHHGPATGAMKTSADGSVVVDARATLRDITRRTGIALPDEGDWTTVAGLAIAFAQKIPLVGDRIELPTGIVLEIVEASARRVKKVRVRPAPEPAAD